MATSKGPAPRGGGTSASAPRQRILRIGVLLGGKIVEERLIRERVPVSIGQSMKNTFSIPIEGLPLEFTLFAIDEGRYSLRFLSKMDGRLSDAGGQVNTLEALKSKGASNHGDYYQAPLTDSARGKLSLGDLTILFQFVTEPPRQPKPMLPASVRGTFADRFDPRLLVIVGTSIILHFMVVIIAWMGDIEKRGLAGRVYDLTFEPEKYTTELKPEPEQVTEVGSAAGSAAEAKKPEQGPPKPKNTGNDGGRDKKDDVAMTEDDATLFANKLVFDAPDGKDQGGMANRNPNTDIGKQVEAAKEGNREVKAGGGSGRGSRGDGDPRLGTGGGPKINGPGGVESAGGGKTTEKGPAGRISVSSKTALDESTLTADAVLAKIQSVYMAGLKRCYKNYLNKDATARGGVVLSLTVTESGSTVNGSAKGFAGEVDDCITAQMGGWRFAVPKDKDGEKTQANFQIKLQLLPD
jgi:hypothetical protein